MTAGSTVVFFSCPFELVKLQVQLQQLVARTMNVPPKFVTSFECAKYILKTRGKFLISNLFLFFSFLFFFDMHFSSPSSFL